MRFNLFKFFELIGAFVFENYGASTLWLGVARYLLNGFRGCDPGSRDTERGADRRPDGKLSAVLVSQ
ncbi:hypothetical protein D3C75_1296840 [compost metagenome]